MRTLAATLALFAAGCSDAPPAEPPPGAIVEEDVAEFVRDPGPKPYLVTYHTPGEGGPEIFRAAIVAGVLDFTGRCVRLQDHGGAMRTLVTTSGSGLKRDSLGWFLPSGRDRLRHGATVEGGGGELPSLPPVDMLANVVPAECTNGPAIELIGAHRAKPRQGTIDEPPPPPETPPRP
ncbi:MAG: hypothetical protein ACR2FK_03985 [Sphingomicrobium sp.]